MGKTNVILADDHAVVRTGIRKVVEEIPNIEVVAEAGDGPQVFATLAEFNCDCLLIDVNMPDFEPVSAIRQIRDNYPKMKILVISAYDDDFYVQGMLAAGVDGYHLKDQPLSDLKLAIQRILGGERWISSPLLTKLLETPERAANAPKLTDRQRDLLVLLRKGMDNQTIARYMNLSVKTVENNLTRLYRQLNVQSRLEAVNYSIQHPAVLGYSSQISSDDYAGEQIPAHSCVSVLVVDDNARYRRQLQHMIGKLCPNAVIYAAEGTETAIHLARRVSPQLVFVDVVLGDSDDGIRCTRRIKASSSQSRVILISAYPDREFHRLGLQAGAVAFLDKKDLDMPTLSQVINDVIQ